MPGKISVPEGGVKRNPEPFLERPFFHPIMIFGILCFGVGLTPPPHAPYYDHALIFFAFIDDFRLYIGVCRGRIEMKRELSGANNV